ncbi:hypothetical protein DPMN_060089 [Dreissena polymorpha]|uniref:Uncharacterized protein n=1 Tax=Dreissena polymorpha TaxID=45954 RepID=A0A9D4HHU1_DREPO|nr:hypothetical protein DPMN_060089 [Dreissena polymorpha]
MAPDTKVPDGRTTPKQYPSAPLWRGITSNFIELISPANMLLDTKKSAAEADAYPNASCLTDLEVNRCKNEEVILKGNFGWVWSMWAGSPRVGNGAMHMNRCRNEEIIVKSNFGWAWSMWAGRLRYQFEVNWCRNKAVNFQGSMSRTDRQTPEMTTIFPRFLKSVGIMKSAKALPRYGSGRTTPKQYHSVYGGE